VYTARYGLIPSIKQITFRLLKVNVLGKEMLTKYSYEILKQRNRFENLCLESNVVLNWVINLLQPTG